MTSVVGSAIAYRLYDIGYSIDLEKVESLFAEASRGRARPARLEAQAFIIRNPPVSLALGERVVSIQGEEHRARLSARLYDFGVCSMRLTAPVPEPLAWSDFASFGIAFAAEEGLVELLNAELSALIERIRPAVERPSVASICEDYAVFRVDEIAGPAAAPRSAFADEELVALLLGERRALAPAARQDLLANRFSYYADDLAVLTWDNALVVEPRRDDEDVEFVLEFANAQLLELRLYDAHLDDQLPAVYDRIAERRRRLPLVSRGYRPLMSQLQTRVAEITEVVERADNAFKVTDDVYLARVYAAALELFRERTWRRGIDRKLQILRDTYGMLNAEAQVARAEALEWIVVVLIAAELIIGLFR